MRDLCRFTGLMPCGISCRDGLAPVEAGRESLLAAAPAVLASCRGHRGWIRREKSWWRKSE